jgi:hypothetical protein
MLPFFPVTSIDAFAGERGPLPETKLMPAVMEPLKPSILALCRCSPAAIGESTASGTASVGSIVHVSFMLPFNVEMRRKFVAGGKCAALFEVEGVGGSFESTTTTSGWPSVTS